MKKIIRLARERIVGLGFFILLVGTLVLFYNNYKSPSYFEVLNTDGTLIAIIKSMSWSPSGDRLAIVGIPAKRGLTEFITWEVSSKAVTKHDIDIPDELLDVAWNPKSDIIALSSSDNLYLMSFQTSKLQQITSALPDALHIDWNDDGTKLARKGSDYFQVWDTLSNELLSTQAWDNPSEPHPYIQSVLSWSPDGATVSYCNEFGEPIFWGVEESKTIGATEIFQLGTWANNKNIVICNTSNQGIKGWENNSLVFTLEDPQTRLKELTFSPDDTFIVGIGVQDQVFVWPSDSRQLQVINLLTGIQELESPIEWNITRQELAIRSNVGLDISNPDGNSWQGQVWLIDPKGGNLLKNLRFNSHWFVGVVEVKWQPNGNYLAIIADNKVMIWESE